MCYVGWTVWVQGGSAIRCMSKLIIVRSMVTYYLCCRNYMYIYTLYLSYTYTYLLHGAESFLRS